MAIWSKCDICGRDVPVGELCYGLKKGNCICKDCCTGFENCTFTLAPAPTLTPLSTLHAENEKLRETVDKYATAARVIALHLKPFCDESLPYDEMIADAARKASDELEQVKRERDAIEQDFRAFTKQWWEQDSGFPCRWCKFENFGGCEWKAKQPNEEKICAGRAFEWRGQKEG